MLRANLDIQLCNHAWPHAHGLILMCRTESETFCVKPCAQRCCAMQCSSNRQEDKGLFCDECPMHLQAESNFKRPFAIAGIHGNGILSSAFFDSLPSNSALAYIFHKDEKTFFQCTVPGSHRTDISNCKYQPLFYKQRNCLA